MPGPLQLHPPTPLEYFATLVADDASLSLVEAAASIGQDEDPQLDIQAVLSEIDALARRLKVRVPADAAVAHRLRTLNHFFFRDLGFAGNINDYHDPGNSLLGTVLRTRRGIPITLAVLYIEFASHIGLAARGVSFPGHFLVKLRVAEGEVVIDPFSGQSLSRDELDERLAPYRRRQGLEGDFDVPLGLFLQAASPREVLARMLHNLKEIHRNAHDWKRLLPVMHRLVILLPRAWEERRDRGLVHAELGDAEAAIHDLAQYVAHCPDAPDHAVIAKRLLGLGDPPAGRLH